MSKLPKERALLFGSLAGNIFLAAFILGRLSMPGMMPPPPPFGGPMPPAGMHGEMPPPPPGGAPGMAGMMPPPPPPFFGPGDLFTPEEMKGDLAKMQEIFEKSSKLRTDFARQLKEGSVSSEQVLKHFAEMDQLMDGVRKQMQEKAAAKISGMKPEERQRFAEKLLQRP